MSQEGRLRGRIWGEFWGFKTLWGFPEGLALIFHQDRYDLLGFFMAPSGDFYILSWT